MQVHGNEQNTMGGMLREFIKICMPIWLADKENRLTETV